MERSKGGGTFSLTDVLFIGAYIFFLTPNEPVLATAF